MQRYTYNDSLFDFRNPSNVDNELNSDTHNGTVPVQWTLVSANSEKLETSSNLWRIVS